MQMKENYENVKQLLIKINFAQFMWYVCDDFKILIFAGSAGWIQFRSIVKQFVKAWILKEKFFKKSVHCFPGYQRPK